MLGHPWLVSNPIAALSFWLFYSSINFTPLLILTNEGRSDQCRVPLGTGTYEYAFTAPTDRSVPCPAAGMDSSRLLLSELLCVSAPCCLSSHICWEVEGVLRAGLPDAVVWLLDCAHQAHDSLSRQDHSEHFVVYILCSSLDSVQITGANTESRVTPATALYMHPQMICANFCSPMKKALFQPHL